MKNYILIFFTVLLVLIFIFVAVCGAELYLQVKWYRHNLQRITSFSDLFEIAPFLQVRPHPNPAPEININEENLRGDPINLDPRTFLIVVFGGSTTFQINLPYEESYPRILERKLREKYPGVNIQVQNAACDWYTTQHSLIRYLFKVRHYNPDLILVMHAINDLCRSFVPDNYSRPGEKYRVNYSHFYGPLAAIANGDHLPFRYFLLWESIKWHVEAMLPSALKGRIPLKAPDVSLPKVSRAVPVSEFKSLKSFDKNLRLFAQMAKSYSQELIFLTQPNVYRADLTEEEQGDLYFGYHYMTENGRTPDLASLTHAMRLFNDTTLRVAEDTQTPVVDLEKHIPKTFEYFEDDVHPKASAAAIEAELVFKKIVELGVIDKWVSHLSNREKNVDREYEF